MMKSTIVRIIRGARMVRAGVRAGMMVTVPLLLVLAMATPGLGRVVTIKTAALLADRSDASIELALRGAVETCVRGAVAMGLSWISLQDAVLLGDQVIVQMIASDDDEDEEGAEPVPDAAPTPRSL